MLVEDPVYLCGLEHSGNCAKAGIIRNAQRVAFRNIQYPVSSIQFHPIITGVFSIIASCDLKILCNYGVNLKTRLSENAGSVISGCSTRYLERT